MGPSAQSKFGDKDASVAPPAPGAVERSSLAARVLPGDDDTEESLDRYRLLSQHARDIVLFIRPDGRIAEANDAAVAAYGHDRDALRTLTVYDLRDPATAPSVADQLLEADGRGLTFETVHRRKDGAVFPVEVSSRGADVGGERLLLSIIRDISERKRTEAALRESEERYRDLFENANDVIYTLDLEGRITSVNKRAEQTFGYTLDECLGSNAADIVPPEYHSRMRDALRRKLEGEAAPTTYELEIIRKDGRRVPLEVSSRLIVRDGKATGVQGIARDVTERRQAEAEREQLIKQREAERAFLEAVLQQMPGGVVIAEAPSGRIVLDNGQGPALPLAGTVPPADVSQYGPLGGLFLGARYSSPEDWPLLRSLRTGEVVRGEEMEFRLPDGGRGALQASSAPVRDPRGRIIAAVATWFDVTARKRAEDAQHFLADAGEALAASLDPDVMLERVARLAVPALADWCAIDVLAEGRSIRRVAVVHADPVKVEMGRELLRRYPPRLDMPEGGPMRTGEPLLLPEITDDVLASGARDAGHLEILRQLDLRSCMVAPLSARGRVLGAIVLATAESGRRYGTADLALAVELARRAALAVDNARLYQALREADRRKDDFLAMLAHELRNPLAPIRNAAQVLKLLGPPQPELGRVREMIERQVAHLARLVDDLLDVSRISRGKVLLRKERLDLVPLVRAAAEDQRPLLEAAGLKLAVDLPDRPLWALGDPTRLVQVVGNLLHNAGKFTDAGGLVAVRLAAEGDGGEAVLSVRDTGIGMEPDILGRLFEPFSQADRSLDRSRGGLGLGLALVKGLAELHGGGVRASSPGPGQGSEFAVLLPLSAKLPGREAAPHDRPARGRSLHILVIEDNRDAAESLRMLLELSGHEAAVAHAGAAGVEAARRLRPDVVLCDIGLPGGMDGYAVARALRADPELSLATLIALSGYAQEEDQRKARQAGYDRYLTKPMDPPVLMELLDLLPVRPGR